jgi:signal peptidase I
VLVTPWAFYGLIGVRLAAVAEAARRGRRGVGDGEWQWPAMAVVGGVGLGIMLVARLEVIEPSRVPSDSMAPTIAHGDRIIVDKVTLRFRRPRRGEVVAFRMGGKMFVKRVIAFGGEHVSVRDGVVRANGVEVRAPVAPDPRVPPYPNGGRCGEDRAANGTKPATLAADGTCVVPAGTVFVMGDNRVNSADSRYVGAIPVAWVFGRVAGVD